MTKCHQCLRLYCCKDDLTEHINTCSPEKRRFSDYDLFRGRNMAMLSPAKLAGSSALDNYGSAYRRHTIESMLSKDERLNSERMVRSPSISTKWCFPFNFFLLNCQWMVCCECCGLHNRILQILFWKSIMSSFCMKRNYDTLILFSIFL